MASERPLGLPGLLGQEGHTRWKYTCWCGMTSQGTFIQWRLAHCKESRLKSQSSIGDLGRCLSLFKLLSPGRPQEQGAWEKPASRVVKRTQ